MQRIGNEISAAIIGGIILAAAGAANASAVDLTFATAPGNGILDSTGAGTGFTARLSGTGASNVNGSSEDQNLTVDTTAHVLDVFSGTANTDFSGNSNPGAREAVGINLSTLGIGSNQDFTATAKFIGVPATAFSAGGQGFPQLGIYLGNVAASGTSATLRTGIINFASAGGAPSEYFSQTNNGTTDGTPVFGNATTGTEQDFTITRIGGVYTVTDNGDVVTPSGIGLSTTGDLNIGVYASAVQGPSFTGQLSEFSVTALPEPGSLALVGLGATALLSRRRRRLA